MHTNRRLSARVLASLTVLLAACGAGSRVDVASRPVSTVAVYAGPTSPRLADQLHHAAETDAAGRWYQAAAARDAWFTWAASLPPIVVHQAARPSSGHTGADPAIVGGSSGDRFDRLAQCESSMNQDASDGQSPPHLSFFQWLLSTWHAAGGTGDPRDADYATQKPIAESWAQTADPFRQWPHCWPASA